MKKFIENIKNIWSVAELRERILITLGLILIFRFGAYVVLPGVDSAKLASASDSKGVLETLLGIFSGGAFSNASIMSLGIMPYISASIIMQLLGMAVPKIQKMQADGESGRKQINLWTRVGTIVICALQAPSYLNMQVGDAIPQDPSSFWWIQTTVLLVAGTMFAVWIGERITDRGIGNGISLLITVGILSRFPAAIIAEIGLPNTSPLKFFLECLGFFAIIILTILIVQGVRRIPLNFAGRIVGARATGSTDGARQYLPIKINASGVMPIIFAQAIMTIPLMLAAGEWMNNFGWRYNLLLAVLIVVFTYLYTAIMINPRKMAEDLQKSGGFIPGVKPGEETQAYIDSLVTRITLPGSLFLAAIAVLPALAKACGVGDQFALFFGGTTILIMVGVVLDTLQQIETFLVNRQMDGLMTGGGRIRGRQTLEEVKNG